VNGGLPPKAKTGPQWPRFASHQRWQGVTVILDGGEPLRFGVGHLVVFDAAPRETTEAMVRNIAWKPSEN
jgi:hypothetical protein